MQFDFDKELVSNNYVDIDDLGNCAIQASNDECECYYLVIQTKLGKSLVFEYGPIVPDLEMLPDKVTTNISYMDYNQKELAKIIKFFLNDKTRNIKYADTFTKNDLLSECRDLIEYTRRFNDDQETN